jgi:apolipoprotein N-acyltransferase
VRTTQEYTELAARFQYRYRDGQTFYTQHGDWFVGLCWVVAGAVLSGVRRTRKTPA